MKLNPMIVFRKEDSKGVLFDPDSGEIFELNGIGTVIWQELEQEKDVLEIIAKLKELCGDTCPENIADDVQEFLDSLRQNGFLL